MSEWNPIATAPRDRWILICHPKRFIVAGIWKENLNNGTPKAQPGWTDLSVDSFAWETFTRLEPTHWMELPKPPKVEE